MLYFRADGLPLPGGRVAIYQGPDVGSVRLGKWNTRIGLENQTHAIPVLPAWLHCCGRELWPVQIRHNQDLCEIFAAGFRPRTPTPMGSSSDVIGEVTLSTRGNADVESALDRRLVRHWPRRPSAVTTGLLACARPPS